MRRTSLYDHLTQSFLAINLSFHPYPYTFFPFLDVQAHGTTNPP